MKILVCGSRTWDDPYPILRELNKLPLEATIIHGAANGADSLAGAIARRLGFNAVVAVPADWKRYGLGAGPIRNRKMLEMGPDLVLAFSRDIENSKGTRNMVEQARKAGVETRVFDV